MNKIYCDVNNLDIDSQNSKSYYQHDISLRLERNSSVLWCIEVFLHLRYDGIYIFIHILFYSSYTKHSIAAYSLQIIVEITIDTLFFI